MKEELSSTGYTVRQETLQVHKRVDKTTCCLEIRNVGYIDLNIRISILGIKRILGMDSIDHICIHYNPENFNVIAVVVYDSRGNMFMVSEVSEGKVDYTLQYADSLYNLYLRNYDDTFQFIYIFNSLVALKQVVIYRSYFPEA